MNTKFIFVSFFIFIFLLFVKYAFPQEDDYQNPRKWTYFKIDPAKISDDSLFYFLQIDCNPEISDDQILQSVKIYVDLRDASKRKIFLGNPLEKNTASFQWEILSDYVRNGLLNYIGPNKFNLSPNIINYSSPFYYGYKELNPGKLIRPVAGEKQFTGALNFINPYLQLFGGEKLGIPIKSSIGVTFAIGNKYSGPFESDQFSFGVNLYGVSFNYLSRIKGLNTSDFYYSNELVGQFNNIFNPATAFEISYAIPFGNFLEIGYMNIPVRNNLKGFPNYIYYDIKGKQMPNNILWGNYFNFELRYPFSLMEAERSQVYAAYYAHEVHIGLFTRDSKIGNTVFDFRTNFTFSDLRNFQILSEIMFSGFSENFGLRSLAIGPSLRFTKLEFCKFGLHTLMLNARLKIGDYF
jgi:hypothetical protein